MTWAWSCSSRPTTSAASRSGWRRRRLRSRRRASTWSASTCRARSWLDETVARRRARRVLPADAHGHAAGRCRSSTACARSILRRGWRRTACTRRSTPRCCASRASATCSAASSRRSSSRPRKSHEVRCAAPTVTRVAASPRAASVDPLPRTRPRGAAGARRRYATLQMADERGRGRLHRSEPGLQAPVPPLSDRAGLRRPVPRRAGRCRRWRTSARRSPRAPGTSRSAIRISSTASGTRWRSSSGLRASSRASPTTSRSRSSICCSTRTLLPLLRDTGCAFVTTAVESIDDRCARAARQGPHARRLRARRRAVPRRGADAGADVRGVHAVDDARGLLRSAAARSIGWGWSITWRRSSSASGCS